MRRLTAPGWPGNLLAVAAGALTTLALAPFDIWPLALLAVGFLRRLTPADSTPGLGPWLGFRFRPVWCRYQLDLLQHPPLRWRLGAARRFPHADLHGGDCLVLRPASLDLGALAAP